MKCHSSSDHCSKLPDVVKQIILDEATISRTVDRLAHQIRLDYDGLNLLLIGVLKGARPFCEDLHRAVGPSSKLDWIGISRYQRSSGPRKVKIVRDTRTSLKGRHVLLVEDIVDTGLSLNYLIQELKERKPASIHVCTLLDRPGLRLAQIPVRYVGKDVSEDFLIGYGLDYHDRYRDLPYIATMDFESLSVESREEQVHDQQSGKKSNEQNAANG